ncbi:ABC transporter ATP-binding protein [Haloprofundus salilacus]|uniref:ABC transporter ATP-binding protein n=1 Tax=Haloprofundus salilacus TaxID=2876190 RepID=UPI001CC9421F|nr:ABC transporter ATP-binding protein [Haloprofundus salilacus]
MSKAVVTRPLWRILRTFGKEHRPWLGAGLTTGLVQRLVSLLPPFILGIAIDAVLYQTIPFDVPVIPNAWVPATRLEQLYFAIALIAGSFVISSTLSTVRMLSMDYYSHRLMHEVRTATYDTLQDLDPVFFENHERGDLLSVLNNDISNFEIFFDDALTQTVRILTVVIGVTLILLYENAQLAAVTLVSVPLLLVATMVYMRLIEPVFDAIRDSVGKLNTRLENNLGGMTLIKTKVTEGYESDRVDAASWQYFSTNWDRIKLGTVYHPGSSLITDLSFVVTLLVGGYWIVVGPPLFFTGGLTVGTLVTFLFLSQRFTGPLKQITTIIERYENARASGKRVFALLDMEPSITDDPEATTLSAVDGHVEYDHVTFSYEGRGTNDGSAESDEASAPVIYDISFEAEPGESVALVGPTGAGKSTAMKLLPRLYDADGGTIRLDGRDVQTVRLRDLREHIGYVDQEDFLFSGTIAENIRYGSFDAGREDVIEAAKAAQIHQFVTNLTDGYETPVGEEGVKLSGGQRQRLSIARAVLQDPDLLIFDEATSDVDIETEMLIQRGLEEITANRTTFYIAHRLSTIKAADTILVLEDGEIVERGSHKELLAADGLYANLWRVQAGNVDDLPESFLRTISE